MTESKSAAERAVELLLFAPVGLALSARDLLPELVERGRQQVTGQVTLARMLGQLAVQQGQAEAEKALLRARSQAETALGQVFGGEGDGGRGPAPSPSRTAPTPAPTTQAPPPAPSAVPAPDPTPSPTPVPVDEAPATPAAGAPRADELAVPDYDSLSASQVLPRLSGLDPDELEAVRSYEAANRGRKTVLSKVAQLQAS